MDHGKAFDKKKTCPPLTYRNYKEVKKLSLNATTFLNTPPSYDLIELDNALRWK